MKVLWSEGSPKPRYRLIWDGLDGSWWVYKLGKRGTVMFLGLIRGEDRLRVDKPRWEKDWKKIGLKK